MTFDLGQEVFTPVWDQDMNLRWARATVTGRGTSGRRHLYKLQVHRHKPAGVYEHEAIRATYDIKSTNPQAND